MSKNNPASSLSRFMHGVYFHYFNKGMPTNTAKARMYDETLDACFDFVKNEKDIPDHAVVISAQFMYRVINQRGLALAKELKETKDDEKIMILRKALQQLNQVKTSLDEFISTYEGVLGKNGKGKKQV